LRLVTPTTEDRTVTPRRAPNAQLRTREHLTADEVEKLIETVRQNRYGHRDALMVLVAYRHGFLGHDQAADRDFKRAWRVSNVRPARTMALMSAPFSRTAPAR
jgi:hypothetical protein